VSSAPSSRRAGARLPQLELECMKVLWRVPREEGATVAAVCSALDRPLAYTTVLTVLDRMAAKGVVTRRKAGRAFVYSPALDLESARRDGLRRLLADLFGNDADELARHLAQLAGRRQPASALPASKRRSARAPESLQYRPGDIDDSLL
jgi:predicted transcriptional regulator